MAAIRIMLDAPLHRTKRALEKAGMSINDIDLFEVNEGFARTRGVAEDHRAGSGTAQRQCGAKRPAIRSAAPAPS